MRNQTEREREREDGGWTESHIGVTEDVLICSERGGGLLFSLPGENERDREKMGGKVCTGENGSGRLRGSGARREAGEPVCQLLPGSARQPRHTKTQKKPHKGMRTSSVCIRPISSALPGGESGQKEGRAARCQAA